ncbi:cyclopropane-fatty-acyl-phospholipid synthase family protein [Pseudomonadales bacterium]|nr:cyclopropane-fatty-acyl-phospholipid synthase family protein [Pseudomonadales bacterium]
MKTLTLDYLPESVRRKDGWLITLIKRKFYANFSNLEHGNIIFIDGDFTLQCGNSAEPAATVDVHDDRFYTTLAAGGAVGASEAYMQGMWTCDQLTLLVQVLLRNTSVLRGLGNAAYKKPLYKLLHLMNRDSVDGSKKNISAHYDLGNKLFENFLDPTMTYSSGFFEQSDSTMQQASTAKLDRICQKLALSESDHVVEIGTGWGSFALHAARNYNCKITTTTISEKQYQLACQRVKDAGMQDRIEIVKKDYRLLTGQYDKLVSIEMIEAVGLAYLGNYFEKCASLLKPAGKMLIQAITIADQQYEFSKRNVDFIQRYIFPGGALPSVTALTNTATNKTDLRMTALEDITGHYATTMRKWREKFYLNVEQITELGYDNQFLRMWEYYLCYCEGGFEEKSIGCVQAEFTKPTYAK